MDADLRLVQSVRDAVRAAAAAQARYQSATQAEVDRVVAAMVEAGAAAAERLGRLAHEETGFGRPADKAQKNLFATRTLAARIDGMRTAGFLRREGDVWEVAVPVGVVAALVPSTNPTSTALYKAILAAKARCAVVMSPHPRAARCTAEAVRVVAEAAEAAGAPAGLFQVLPEVSLAATEALLAHPDVALILATGGGPMVRAAYSQGKPAYGVGSGNVPAYVDRSANVAKAAADVLAGASFDWGTLCSTERSVVVDAPVRARLLEALAARGGHVCSADEAAKLRAVVARGGGLNTEIVGQSPQRIAELAGFRVSEATRALLAHVDAVGKSEPLSMETLSPVLSLYTADGWEAGCARCLEILRFGGLGHTLALHATSERVVEQFALHKPAMRIVVNSVAALGSVGMTTALFPALTLGPGAVGGSITSDNLGPLHLVNVKRVAFETAPLHDAAGEPLAAGAPPNRPAEARPAEARPAGDGSWMDRIEARLRARAGNPPAASPSHERHPGVSPARPSPLPSGERDRVRGGDAPALPLADDRIEALVRRFRR